MKNLVKSRLTNVEGEIYFSVSDMAKALGYSNPRTAIIRHCKDVVKRDGNSMNKNQYEKVIEQTKLSNTI